MDFLNSKYKNPIGGSSALATKPEIGSRSYSSVPASPANLRATSAGPARKLGEIAERFNAFQRDLEAERTQKVQSEMQHRIQTSERLARLEKALEIEIKKRTETDRQLQTLITQEIKGLSEKVSSQLNDIQRAVRGKFDEVGGVLAELQARSNEERMQRRADLEQVAERLFTRLDACQGAVDEERVARMEQENKILVKLGDDMTGLHERLEHERSAREKGLESMEHSVKDVLASRSAADEKFQQWVLEEISVLKASVDEEKEARIAEDEDIVNALNDYTRALQEGLKIVGV